MIRLIHALLLDGVLRADSFQLIENFVNFCKMLAKEKICFLLVSCFFSFCITKVRRRSFIPRLKQNKSFARSYWNCVTMAAQGAHLTTSSIDKPSIFELVASHSLDSTFYPALKKIAQVIPNQCLHFTSIWHQYCLISFSIWEHLIQNDTKWSTSIMTKYF